MGGTTSGAACANAVERNPRAMAPTPTAATRGWGSMCAAHGITKYVLLSVASRELAERARGDPRVDRAEADARQRAPGVDDLDPCPLGERTASGHGDAARIAGSCAFRDHDALPEIQAIMPGGERHAHGK